MPADRHVVSHSTAYWCRDEMLAVHLGLLAIAVIAAEVQVAPAPI